MKRDSTHVLQHDSAVVKSEVDALVFVVLHDENDHAHLDGKQEQCVEENVSVSQTTSIPQVLELDVWVFCQLRLCDHLLNCLVQRVHMVSCFLWINVCCFFV